MARSEPITLVRNVDAVQIPSGTPVTIPEGTPVMVTQALGGTYTVITDWGEMARIDGKDADAFGGSAPAMAAAPFVASTGGGADAAAEGSLEKSVWDVLKTCFDPEIPANVVDLGLIYEVKVTPLPGGGNRVDVKMTLTAPGCGMGNILMQDATAKIRALAGVSDVNVEMVFDPPWDMSRMSEAAKLQLGMI
jgi:probable FeS assembly SUF system protein SufT